MCPPWELAIMDWSRFEEIISMFFYPKAESTVLKTFLKDMSVIQGDPSVAYKLHRVKSTARSTAKLSCNGAAG